MTLFLVLCNLAPAKQFKGCLPPSKSAQTTLTRCDCCFWFCFRDLIPQAEELVKKLKGDENVNMEEDWKLVTILVGGNDMCDYCESKVC